MANEDVNLLRDLAGQYQDLCELPVQKERRDLWRRHNSLQPTRPLIYVRAFAWNEMPQAQCRCEDPFFRNYENQLRQRLFWGSMNDDSVFEPWITVPADMLSYGFDADRIRTILNRDLAACRDCHVDITLKDVETVERDPNRVKEWVQITRAVVDELIG